jgi:hypothetical protein
MSIARHGYTLFHCPPPTPDDWCGNAGWFPAYPALAATLHVLGLPLVGTALVLSWMFTIATILLIWWTFLDRRLSVAAIGALAYAAFAPGVVYDYAVFPISMLAFSTVLFLWLVDRGRWIAAGLAGAVAGLTYPIGAIIAVPAVIWILLVPRDDTLRERVRRAGLVGGLSLLGPLILVFVQWWDVGRWDAYFLVQAKYGHSLRNPIDTVLDAIDKIVHGPPFAMAKAPSLQTVLVAVVLVCVLVEVVRRRRVTPQVDVLILLWAAVSWVLPHAQGNISIYRSQAALLPLALLVRRLPVPLLSTIVVFAMLLVIPMVQLFLKARLV